MDSIGLTTLVGYNAEGKPEDIRYDKMIIYLVEMIKIQQKSLEDQHNELKNLQKRIIQLESGKRKSKTRKNNSLAGHQGF